MGISAGVLNDTTAFISQTTDVTLNNGTATLLLTADGTLRIRQVIITALQSNSDTDGIRIGDSSVAADEGTPLRPGESITVNSIAAIYGFVAAAGQKVAISYTYI